MEDSGSSGGPSLVIDVPGMEVGGPSCHHDDCQEEEDCCRVKSFFANYRNSKVSVGESSDPEKRVAASDLQVAEVHTTSQDVEEARYRPIVEDITNDSCPLYDDILSKGAPRSELDAFGDHTLQQSDKNSLQHYLYSDNAMDLPPVTGRPSLTESDPKLYHAESTKSSSTSSPGMVGSLSRTNSAFASIGPPSYSTSVSHLSASKKLPQFPSALKSPTGWHKNLRKFVESPLKSPKSRKLLKMQTSSIKEVTSDRTFLQDSGQSWSDGEVDKLEESSNLSALDLYTDLMEESMNQKEEQEQEIKQNESTVKALNEMREEIAELKRQLECKEKEMQKIVTQNRILQQNISAVIRTAQQEMKSKDREILSLELRLKNGGNEELLRRVVPYQPYTGKASEKDEWHGRVSKVQRNRNETSEKETIHRHELGKRQLIGEDEKDKGRQKKRRLTEDMKNEACEVLRYIQSAVSYREKGKLRDKSSDCDKVSRRLHRNISGKSSDSKSSSDRTSGVTDNQYLLCQTERIEDLVLESQNTGLPEKENKHGSRHYERKSFTPEKNQRELPSKCSKVNMVEDVTRPNSGCKLQTVISQCCSRGDNSNGTSKERTDACISKDEVENVDSISGQCIHGTHINKVQQLDEARSEMSSSVTARSYKSKLMEGECQISGDEKLRSSSRDHKCQMQMDRNAVTDRHYRKSETSSESTGRKRSEGEGSKKNASRSYSKNHSSQSKSGSIRERCCRAFDAKKISRNASAGSETSRGLEMVEEMSLSGSTASRRDDLPGSKKQYSHGSNDLSEGGETHSKRDSRSSTSKMKERARSRSCSSEKTVHDRRRQKYEHQSNSHSKKCILGRNYEDDVVSKSEKYQKEHGDDLKENSSERIQEDRDQYRRKDGHITRGHIAKQRHSNKGKANDFKSDHSSRHQLTAKEKRSTRDVEREERGCRSGRCLSKDYYPHMKDKADHSSKGIPSGRSTVEPRRSRSSDLTSRRDRRRKHCRSGSRDRLTRNEDSSHKGKEYSPSRGVSNKRRKNPMRTERIHERCKSQRKSRFKSREDVARRDLKHSRNKNQRHRYSSSRSASRETSPQRKRDAELLKERVDRDSHDSRSERTDGILSDREKVVDEDEEDIPRGRSRHRPDKWESSDSDGDSVGGRSRSPRDCIIREKNNTAQCRESANSVRSCSSERTADSESEEELDYFDTDGDYGCRIKENSSRVEASCTDGYSKGMNKSSKVKADTGEPSLETGSKGDGYKGMTSHTQGYQDYGDHKYGDVAMEEEKEERASRSHNIKKSHSVDSKRTDEMLLQSEREYPEGEKKLKLIISSNQQVVPCDVDGHSPDYILELASQIGSRNFLPDIQPVPSRDSPKAEDMWAKRSASDEEKVHAPVSPMANVEQGDGDKHSKDKKQDRDEKPISVMEKVQVLHNHCKSEVDDVAPAISSSRLDTFKNSSVVEESPFLLSDQDVCKAKEKAAEGRSQHDLPQNDKSEETKTFVQTGLKSADGNNTQEEHHYDADQADSSNRLQEREIPAKDVESPRKLEACRESAKQIKAMLEVRPEATEGLSTMCEDRGEVVSFDASDKITGIHHLPSALRMSPDSEEESETNIEPVAIYESPKREIARLECAPLLEDVIILDKNNDMGMSFDTSLKSTGSGHLLSDLRVSSDTGEELESPLHPAATSKSLEEIKVPNKDDKSVDKHSSISLKPDEESASFEASFGTSLKSTGSGHSLSDLRVSSDTGEELESPLHPAATSKSLEEIKVPNKDDKSVDKHSSISLKPDEESASFEASFDTSLKSTGSGHSLSDLRVSSDTGEELESLLHPAATSKSLEEIKGPNKGVKSVDKHASISLKPDEESASFEASFGTSLKSTGSGHLLSDLRVSSDTGEELESPLHPAATSKSLEEMKVPNKDDQSVDKEASISLKPDEEDASFEPSLTSTEDGRLLSDLRISSGEEMESSLNLTDINASHNETKVRNEDGQYVKENINVICEDNLEEDVSLDGSMKSKLSSHQLHDTGEDEAQVHSVTEGETSHVSDISMEICQNKVKGGLLLKDSSNLEAVRPVSHVSVHPDVSIEENDLVSNGLMKAENVDPAIESHKSERVSGIISHVTQSVTGKLKKDRIKKLVTGPQKKLEEVVLESKDKCDIEDANQMDLKETLPIGIKEMVNVVQVGTKVVTETLRGDTKSSLDQLQGDHIVKTKSKLSPAVDTQLGMAEGENSLNSLESEITSASDDVKCKDEKNPLEDFDVTDKVKYITVVSRESLTKDIQVNGKELQIETDVLPTADVCHARSDLVSLQHLELSELSTNQSITGKTDEAGEQYSTPLKEARTYEEGHTIISCGKPFTKIMRSNSIPEQEARDQVDSIDIYISDSSLMETPEKCKKDLFREKNSGDKGVECTSTPLSLLKNYSIPKKKVVDAGENCVNVFASKTPESMEDTEKASSTINKYSKTKEAKSSDSKQGLRRKGATSDRGESEIKKEERQRRRYSSNKSQRSTVDQKKESKDLRDLLESRPRGKSDRRENGRGHQDRPDDGCRRQNIRKDEESREIGRRYHKNRPNNLRDDVTKSKFFDRSGKEVREGKEKDGREEKGEAETDQGILSQQQPEDLSEGEVVSSSEDDMAPDPTSNREKERQKDAAKRESRRRKCSPLWDRARKRPRRDHRTNKHRESYSRR